MKNKLLLVLICAIALIGCSESHTGKIYKKSKTEERRVHTFSTINSIPVPRVIIFPEKFYVYINDENNNSFRCRVDKNYWESAKIDDTIKCY